MFFKKRLKIKRCWSGTRKSVWGQAESVSFYRISDLVRRDIQSRASNSIVDPLLRQIAGQVSIFIHEDLNEE